MCDEACIEFGKSHLFPDEIENKKVIEVGAFNINGSLRAVVENLNPLSYTGVDMVNGLGVDEICDINNLVARYGKESYDVVISTELLEHVLDWRGAVSNLKNILKPNGILLLTTRSWGFPYHDCPFDFWRYEVDDIKVIFSDMSIYVIERDYLSPGVFIKAHKPVSFFERNLEVYDLYSVVRRRRCRNIRKFDVLFFEMTWPAYWFISLILPARLKAIIRKIIFGK